jgi:hypothetical protein
VHGIRNLRRLSPYHADLHTHHPASAPPLDRLGQPHPRRGAQGRTSPPPRPLGVPVGAADLPPVHGPSVAHPDEPYPSLGPLARQPDHLRSRLLRPPRKPGHHEMGDGVYTQAPPARAHPCLRAPSLSSLWTLFLTNDQKASTSTWLR